MATTNRGPRKPLAVPAVLHPQGLLRLEQVLTLVPMPPTSWYAGMAEGIYPKPVRISARSVCWKVSDILKLMASFETVEEIDPNITKACAATKAKRVLTGEVV